MAYFSHKNDDKMTLMLVTDAGDKSFCDNYMTNCHQHPEMEPTLRH